jgi:hypothetical protein
MYFGTYSNHRPGFFFNAFSNDAYIEGLAACKKQVGQGFEAFG